MKAHYARVEFMIPDFEKWRVELLFTGKIVPDYNKIVPQEEAERRWNRYVELLEMVEGDEGQEVLEAIINSAQAKPNHDYGAYQTLITVVGKFPGEIFAKGFAKTISDLFDRDEEFTGDLLLELGKVCTSEEPPCSDVFNEGLESLDPASREKIVNYIRLQEEPDGWLENFVGEFAPPVIHKILTPEETEQLKTIFNQLLKKHGILNGDMIAFTTRISVIRELLEEAKSINNTQFIALWNDYLEARESF